MCKILQHQEPTDFDLATGITTTIREFVKIAFDKINVTIQFVGKRIHKVGIVSENEGPYSINAGTKVVKIDDSYYRPAQPKSR